MILAKGHRGGASPVARVLVASLVHRLCAFTYNVVMTTGPSSVRFDPDVLRRLSAYVDARPGTSLSATTSRLVDEALRSQEHPLVVFRDGPGGRRARLVPGPDVWEVIRAVRGVRMASPRLRPEGVIELVTETSGVPIVLVRAAIEYWSAYPDEVDAMVERADHEQTEARRRWEREQGLLAG